MRNYDRLALIAVILLVAARITSVLSDVVIAHVYPTEVGHISNLARIAALSTMPLLVAVNLGIGIWLFRESRKDGGAPWIWLLFGFLFQLVAVAGLLPAEDPRRIKRVQSLQGGVASGWGARRLSAMGRVAGPL